MNKKKSLAIDMDDTMFDFVAPLLLLYNKRYNDNVAIEDIKEYTINPFLKPECKSIFGEFATNEYIINLQPYKDCVRVMNEAEKKYDLKIVTAGHPYTCAARHDLLSKFFPWYTSSHFVRIADKSELPFDILIDDCPTHFEGYKGAGVMFEKPWNINSDLPVIKVNNWKQIESVLLHDFYVGIRKTILKANEYIKNGFSAEDAEKMTIAIQDVLSNSDGVEIDFDGVRFLTAFFFSQSLTYLIGEMGLDEYNKRVSILNLSESGNITYRYAYDYAIKYYNL
jgi:5'(3')-deoxyribonucleotidase